MSGRSYRSPWFKDWREEAWTQLDQKWDLIIVGGGITGAGILAVAARSGLRVLLLEKNDFSSGTSSKSSKLVHGGLRYLKRMQVKLTRESIQEKQYLLKAAPGLIEPLGFVYPVYEGDRPSPWLIEIGLGIYTRMASEEGDYRRLDDVDIGMIAPGLTRKKLLRGFHYTDAKTDDARLVLRVLHDGLIGGGGKAVALNYAFVTGLLKERGQVTGVQVCDQTTGNMAEAYARVVINATGVWADRLRAEVNDTQRLRPLRGSHLFFSLERFPVYQAIAFSHPDDGRPVFVYPWENVALVGTTDVDHSLSLDSETAISPEEGDYLLRAVQCHFPELELGRDDVLTTQAGVRPVVDTGKADPSAESREHVLWKERGLLTVTGGKLTTFRVIAIDTLEAAHEMNAQIPSPDAKTGVFEQFALEQEISGIPESHCRRLWARYGAAAPLIVSDYPNLLAPIPDTPYLWAEMAWAAGNEAVQHLDDLLFRRFRLNILLPDGGLQLILPVRSLLQKILDWEDVRWDKEFKRCGTIWQEANTLPQE
jgi:glycerol-3-phosphate dehydrogenase